jgi:hypothetical protein
MPERCRLCKKEGENVRSRDWLFQGLDVALCSKCIVNIFSYRSYLRMHPQGDGLPVFDLKPAEYLQIILAEQICPVCRQPLVGKKQSGKAVVALPCMHRIYQGKAQLQ